MATNASRRRKALFLDALSFLLFIAGVVAMCCPNFWARRTYVSENALLPGSAEHKFNSQDYYLATQITHQWIVRGIPPSDSYSNAKFLLEKMESLGLESYLHSYSKDSTNSINSTESYNVYSVVRAPKSSGTESIVIAATFNREEDANAPIGTSSSLGLAIALQKYFQKNAQKWMAKDIVIVLADEHSGSEYGLKKWLESYLGLNEGNQLKGLSSRHGLIQAAIVLDIIPSNHISGFYVSLVGANGHLPNLDLFNTFNQVCNQEGYYDEELELTEMPKEMKGYFEDAKNGLANLLKDFVPPQIFESIRNPPSEVFGLFGFMMNQAVGVPTGNHGVFNMYHLDAMTIRNRDPKGVWNRKHPVVSIGKVVEGTVRSLNNLLEKLHQSFYYYLLPSSSRYLAIGDYMIPLGLMLAGTALKIVLILISLNHDRHAAHSIALVSVYQLLGMFIFLLPFPLENLSNRLGFDFDDRQTISIWLASSLLLVLLTKLLVVPQIRRAIPRAEPGRNFGTFLRIPVIIFLAASSLLNYSFVFFASLVVVPLCATVGGANNKVTRLIQFSILMVASPISLVLLFSSITSLDPIELLTRIFVQFKQYSNLTFPFLCLAYIPLTLTLAESVFMNKTNKKH
eukprot:TRINITY_DN4871_c0_g1_i1.p1 TRINITY_DN4871_c0_g1~~TRINITY_DN4871_c0_g1_i1.p1  ORF type:complete len:626 (-),score=240.20 TRINITY_DN4871_c0_g1_i1:147-2024(-)